MKWRAIPCCFVLLAAVSLGFNVYQQREILNLNLVLAEATMHNVENNQVQQNYEQAMKDWDGTTQSGIEIHTTYGNQWKQVMEDYYSLLQDKLSDEDEKLLVQNQDAWIWYCTSQENLNTKIRDQLYSGGSIAGLMTSEFYYQKYCDRAKQLMEYYKTLSVK